MPKKLDLHISNNNQNINKNATPPTFNFMSSPVDECSPTVNNTFEAEDHIDIDCVGGGDASVKCKDRRKGNNLSLNVQENDAESDISLHMEENCNDDGKRPKWSFIGVVNAAFKTAGGKGKFTVTPKSQNEDDPEVKSLTSTSSYYMDRDFRYYFQHPFFRLAVAYLVTFCNFLIYAEDPIAHSEKECFIPVVGNCFSFVCTKYPANAWAVLKVIFWLIAILTGTVIGKLVIHKLIFNKLFRLKMFANGQGSWMTMFFTTIACLFIFSWLYNAFLLIGGDSTVEYRISDLMDIKNSLFMKAAATGTWCGDFFTAWMVTDIMLQETKLYPDWARPIRKWWNQRYNRIILFWIVVIVTTVVVVTVIATNWIKWDKLNRDFVASNEISRAFLASFILVMDLLIVMQDWDFPYFVNNFDIKLPGLNTAKLTFHIPKCLKKEKWIVHITGKWFNYGIIFIVMILDLNMWKNQIFYTPHEYGQYAGPDGKIYTVLDNNSLELHNETLMNYGWRSNNTFPFTNLSYSEMDMVMNSRYYGYPLAVKGIAFVPSLAAFVIFGLFIWFFGRWHPSENDPYGGRLKKKTKSRHVSKWRKVRAFFYAKSKFDARLKSYRKRKKTDDTNPSNKIDTVDMCYIDSSEENKEMAINGNQCDEATSTGNLVVKL